MQNAGISTHLRDLKDEFLETWEEVTEDEVIELHEIEALLPLIQRKAALIDHQDDAIRLALTIVKVGPGSNHTKQRIREHERLHGPIRFGDYTRRKKHCRHGNDDSAA